MKTTIRLRQGLLWSAFLFACGGKDPKADTSATNDTSTTESSEGMSETGDAATGATTSSTSTTDEVTTGGSTMSFVGMPDGGGVAPECDQWVQDCPPGKKCMPYSSDGDNAWDSTLCADLDPNPQAPGNACKVEGGAVSGFDNCELGAMCWNVDPMTSMGVCVAMCDGTPDNPQCESGSSCLNSNNGVLTLCLPSCDPLVQDCVGDDLCIPNPQDQSAFLCVLDASGGDGTEFTPCEYINSCAKGLTCQEPALSNECDPEAIGCCVSFCDLSMPACTNMDKGEECLAWYAEGQAPPGFENVGVCGIPQG